MNKPRFKVTGLGLKIDNRMILPGSQLILSSTPPSHWQRFGEEGGDVSEPQEVHVATPEPTPEPTPDPEPTPEPAKPAAAKPKTTNFAKKAK